jgi:hypothetical protein
LRNLKIEPETGKKSSETGEKSGETGEKYETGGNQVKMENFFEWI